MCKNQEEMLKELREEVVLNVLLNNESEFEEYCEEKGDFTCLSSNVDYICHLLDKAEIEVKTGFKVKECYSPSNEFAIRTVYAFVIEEYKHVSIDAILYICFDECEGEVVSVGLERITTLQEVKEKFLKYEEDLIFKIMAVKCYEDYKLEMFSDEKIVINIETLEDVPF
jgi:hypothetical protein